MPDTIADRIDADAISGISETTVGNETVKAIPIKDLIAADNHIANKQVAASGGIGVYIQRTQRIYE